MLRAFIETIIYFIEIAIILSAPFKRDKSYKQRY